MVCEVAYERAMKKGPVKKGPAGTGQEKTVNLAELLSKYEQIEAKLQELLEEKNRIREILFGELSVNGIEETSVITATGTKFILRIQKTKRERVDVKLLRKELGEKAEEFITVTESEFLSIRPAKKNSKELEVSNG